MLRSEKKPHPAAKMVGDKHAAALILRELSWSDRRIGKALSVAELTVRNWRRKFGIDALPVAQRKIDDAIAVEMYSDGASDPEIAERFGVTSNAATYWRRRRGLESLVPRASELTGPETRKVKALLRKGETLKQVAAATGRSKGAIERVRRAIRGEPGLRKQGQSIANDRAKILKLDPVELHQRLRRAVGFGLPPHEVDEAVSEITLALLEGRLRAPEIEREAGRFRSQVIGTYSSKYGPLSLDFENAETGMSLGDSVIDEHAQAEIEEAAERAFSFP